MRSNKLWVTWEKQQRNRSMSKSLNCELHEIISEHRGFLRRYIKSSFATFMLYRKERPCVIFAQNPSLILASISILYGKLTKTTVIIDAHNAGIKPFEGRIFILNLLADFIIREADLTIVTNELLAEYARSKNGRPVILPDPLPDLNCSNLVKSGARHKIKIFCISSWAIDEPYIEVIAAGQYLDDNIEIFITGNSKGKELKYVHSIPGNVILTGYLDDESYLNRLCDSDLAMVLTLRQDCMVCGAYEAIAAGVPVILSDTPALKSYFENNAIYTQNAAEEIALTINNAVKNLIALKISSEIAKDRVQMKWLRCKQDFDIQVGELMP
ncbi:MAG: glycosyltransferase [Gammaproteobacteria bacterium]|nr:glycosyltransferase [Gammaproteobacteria bacterium]